MITRIIILYDSPFLTEGPCIICGQPAPVGSLICDACAGAIATPDPLCSECGEPLGEADIAAGEVTCAGCGDGEEVERGRKA